MTKKNRLIQLVILLSLTGNFLFLFNGFMNDNDTTNKMLIKHDELKLSAGEITAITPENKTYYAPMSAYYPGTHGFESDDIGGDPAEFNIREGSGTITVDASLDGHANVVNHATTGGSADVGLDQSILQQTNGTIEFWLRTNNSNGRWWMSLIDASDALFQFEIENGWFRYWNGGFTNIVACASNTWYHIRIDIELTAGGYQGLGQNQFSITIDGTQYGPYNDYLSPSDFRTFHTNAYDTGTSTYMDAVGYSWDPNYNMGDNLKEGLLVSFDNTTTLDWMGYSLDGMNNVTILGNTAISMPNYGTHSIQVFGNNSLGTMYNSKIVFFTIDVIPETPPPTTTPTTTIPTNLPGIRGFDLCLLISILSVFIFISIKKKNSIRIK